MQLIFYDTKKKRKCPFTPLQEGLVKIYTCGPTVYAPAHIGNFRTYIFEDLLRRTLKFLGYDVYQVMNLTDVDDKTIRAANEQNVTLNEVTDSIIDEFFKDLDLLRIERAEVYPRATDHIPEMIELVQILLDKGYAYEMDGSIYFSISKFPEYGALSGMKLEQLERGVRVNADEYDKENFRDFALWKAWDPNDGHVYWEAPFGKGRPGWHIECSAMSMKYLGEEFDIHTGGVDNIFPHHENEIAQSVCATGTGFAKWWLHSAHLNLAGEKMSKSLGNIYTISDMQKKGYSMRALRYALLSVHYRQRLLFSDEMMNASCAALDRLDTLWFAATHSNGEGEAREEVSQEIINSRNNFAAGLSDDLNISSAMSALFDFVSSIHRINAKEDLRESEGKAILEFWGEVDSVLGILIPWEQDIPDRVIEMVNERVEARKVRDFTTADKIRNELEVMGFCIEDSREGTIIVWDQGRKLIKNDKN